MLMAPKVQPNRTGFYLPIGNVGFLAAIFTRRMATFGRVGTVVGISVQLGDYPMGRLAGQVDTLHKWLLVRLP